MAQEKEEPEIKVTDRRRFTAEGEPLETEAAGQEQGAGEAAAETATAPPTGASEEREEEDLGERAPLPPPSFEFLVLSLRWQAEMQLGFYPGADPQSLAIDLEGARHSIDLLGILQEKTRGNLAFEEQRLLENSLTELRFRYVEAVGRAAKKP